jgi:hypothetical protein
MAEQTADIIEKFVLRVKEDYESDNHVTLTPERTNNYIMALSGSIAWLAGQLSQLDMQEAKEWGKLREEYGTNAEADRAWKATESGLAQIKLRGLLKGCEIIVQACKKQMKLFESESQNSY